MRNFICFEIYEMYPGDEQPYRTVMVNVNLISHCSRYHDKEFSVVSVLDGKDSLTFLVKISFEELCKKLYAVKFDDVVT